MSQPPQNPWGQPPSDDQYGQQSANGGHGQGPQPYGQQQGYGEGYGQQGYSQGSPSGAYGQPSPNTGYGQDSQGWGQAPSAAPAFGADGQQPYAQHAEPPKKSSKTPLLICAGCAVLALIVLLVGGGIFLFTRDGGEPTDDRTTSEQATTEDGEEPTEEDATTEEATSEEATTEEATSEEATSAASSGGQHAIGETFTVGAEGTTVDVTVGEVNWDATEEVVGMAYAENPEPAAGNRYITVPLTMTYHGAEETVGGLLVIPTYVSGSGAEIETSSALAPEYEGFIATVNDGDTVSYEVVFEIPDAEAESGHFAIVPFSDLFAEPTTVSAA
ncbi:hypothetical protein ACTXJ3_17355 [Brachybacterium paraconglomeratum]|uniref:hypothetical protein n=1 Tax=Brachybacterium paraconglomeratum TaxID=173362 RepID=UPI003FD3F537